MAFFALVTTADRTAIRVDLYRASEYYFRDEVIAWHDWIVVGFGERAFLVHALDLHVLEIALPLYFEAFRASDEYLLILAGQGIVRLDPRGRVIWTNDQLAIDGVQLDAIEDGLIHGSGEWDPPGGWRPFRIRLDTGEIVA